MYAFTQPTRLVRIHSRARKEKIPQGWERHLQDGLNMTSAADIFSLGATL